MDFGESILYRRTSLIRRAIPSDASAVSGLLGRAFQEFEPLYTPEAFVATVQLESGILRRLQEGPLWVVENEQNVTGTVSAVRSDDFLMVRGMAVAPEARGLKIGKALLNLTEDFAHEQGLNRMFLYTTAFLLQAIRLYRSSGFEFTGQKSNPHGTELLRMEKILPRDAGNEVMEPGAKQTPIW
jgi:N-acetylglutamate synthase-like GNAT family acetyltransferase